MKYDRRTREQRKADSSAMIALICFSLIALLAAAALSTDAGGSELEEPAPSVEEKLEGEDTPAAGCAYLDVGEPLGEFVLTAYCPCSRCCGRWADGITATGTAATEGRTIAVDPDIIPYGSTVTLYYESGEEHSYTAEDCGCGIRGNRIDVFFDDHRTAREFGVQSAMVYVEVVE